MYVVPTVKSESVEDGGPDPSKDLEDNRPDADICGNPESRSNPSSSKYPSFVCLLGVEKSFSPIWSRAVSKILEAVKEME